MSDRCEGRRLRVVYAVVLNERVLKDWHFGASSFHRTLSPMGVTRHGAIVTKLVTRTVVGRSRRNLTGGPACATMMSDQRTVSPRKVGRSMTSRVDRFGETRAG
jgi:hypothetical protein